MDVLPSCAAAAGLLGLTSNHPFVFLARGLQETCMKLGECTNGDIVIGVVVARQDGPGGVLLFGSGYVDGLTDTPISRHIEAQLSVGVDSLSSALQQASIEQQGAPVTLPPTLPAATSADLDVLGDAGEDVDQEIDDAAAADLDTMASFDALMDAAPAGPGSIGRDPIPPGSQGPAASPTSARPSSSPAPASPGATPAPAGHSSASTAGRPASSPPPTGLASSTARDRPDSSPTGQPVPAVRGDEERILPSNFTLPGLIVPPGRIQLATGRGAARKEPPPREPTTVTIPDALVGETVRELLRKGKDVSLRARLMDFTSLYKFVIDTLVRRGASDAAPREKVNHVYQQLTPDALRNVTVKFKMPGSYTMLSLITPTFNNAHSMRVASTLAVVLFMQYQRDPFFLWLLTMFREGFKAPAEPGTSNKRGRKRKPSDTVGDDPDLATASGAADGNAGAQGGGGVQGGAAGDGRAGGADAGARGEGDGQGGDPADGFSGAGDGGAPGGGDVQGGAAVEGRVRAAGGGNADGGDGGPAVAPSDRQRAAGGCGEVISDGASPADRVRGGLEARLLMSGGRVVATARVHPEHATFHGSPIPVEVVPCFIQTISTGCEMEIYPYGQDPGLCLEKGYPSPVPVTLGAVGSAYKIAWPVASIGYVFEMPSFAARASLLFSILHRSEEWSPC